MVIIPRGVARRWSVLLTSLFVALLFTGAASAQWTFWSPGTVCSASGVAPKLNGVGTMDGGTLNTITLQDAMPDTTCTLVVGFSSLRAPFKGGILGPQPDLLLGLTTDAAGGAALPFIWPAVAPPGTTLWWQAWCPDALNPFGFCSSNTLVSVSS